MSRQRLAWIVWTVVLVGSLAAVKALNDSAAGSAHRETAGSMRFGFSLRESAKSRDVDFTHRAPTFDPQLAHIMPQVASMGAWVAVADFDRDGFADFYVTNSGEGSLNHLYRNKGNGTFEDVAEAMGVADLNGVGASMGAVWGDYDNDGYDDLLVYKYGRPELFHNEHGREFTRV